MKDACFNLALQALAGAPPNTLWIVDENLPVHTLMELPGSDVIVAMTNRVDTANHLKSIGVSVLLGDFNFDEQAQFQRIVYRISKEKLLAHHCINQSLEHLRKSSELILIGNKQDGIKSITKNIADVFGLKNNTQKVGSSYKATFSKPDNIESKLPTNDYGRLRQITHQGETFYSKPGVFGWDKVDRGSQLLVTTLPKVKQYMKTVNSVLDLGCGWGYLMLATRDWEIAVRCATDNNMAAIDAASRNFAEAGIAVDCRADDCASEIRDRFDLILCNPPFHKGFAVSDSMTKKFLSTAARLSRRSTRAIFVVNQFIPLDKLASEYFSECRELASEDGFIVYELRA